MTMRPDRSTVSESGRPRHSPISATRSSSMRISTRSASGRFGDMVITVASRSRTRLTVSDRVRRVPGHGGRYPVGDQLLLVVAVQVPWRLGEGLVRTAAHHHAVLLLRH